MSKELCRPCGQTFTGTTAGDMHRVGDHAVSVGPDRRRCLTVEEMEARGMVQNRLGHWMTKAGGGHFGLPVDARSDEQGESGELVHSTSVRPCTQYGSEVE